MNNYIVIDAISNIDDDLLAQHLKKRLELKNKEKKIFVKWSALAACMCFVIAISCMLVPIIQNYMTEAETVKGYSIGKTVENKYGALTLIESDVVNKTCMFTLVKKNNTPIYFKFGGVVIKEEYTDEQGVSHKKIQMVDVITHYDGYEPEHGHKVIDVNLLINVNGELVDSIPTAPGEYEIKIDYSELYNSLYAVEDVVEVLGFGNFFLEQ